VTPAVLPDMASADIPLGTAGLTVCPYCAEAVIVSRGRYSIEIRNQCRHFYQVWEGVRVYVEFREDH